MIESKHLLTQHDAQRIEWGQAIEKPYLYLPVIYYSDTWKNTTEYHDEIWHSLRYSDEVTLQSLLGYTGKVSSDKTLWQAVRHDLEKDFNFPHEKSFTIESAKPYDTAKDADGNTLSRLLVFINVREPLDIATAKPLGVKLHWHNEGEDEFNPIWDYFR